MKNTNLAADLPKHIHANEVQITPLIMQSMSCSLFLIKRWNNQTGHQVQKHKIGSIHFSATEEDVV